MQGLCRDGVEEAVLESGTNVSGFVWRGLIEAFWLLAAHDEFRPVTRSHLGASHAFNSMRFRAD